jgi:hypothetical protein
MLGRNQPLQPSPSGSKPSLQVHSKLPGVLEHVAFMWQVLLEQHSSISGNYITILIIIIEFLRSTAQSRLNIQRTDVSKRWALSKQLRIRIVENGLVDLEYTIKQFGSLIL